MNGETTAISKMLGWGRSAVGSVDGWDQYVSGLSSAPGMRSGTLKLQSITGWMTWYVRVFRRKMWWWISLELDGQRNAAWSATSSIW